MGPVDPQAIEAGANSLAELWPHIYRKPFDLGGSSEAKHAAMRVIEAALPVLRAGWVAEHSTRYEALEDAARVVDDAFARDYPATPSNLGAAIVRLREVLRSGLEGETP